MARRVRRKAPAAPEPVPPEVEDDGAAPRLGRAELLRRTYMDVDPRALAVFRIGFGLILIGDLGRHLAGLTTWFLDGAVMSPDWVESVEGANTPYSVFLLTTSTPVVTAMLVGCLAIYTLYTVGYRTQLMQVLTFGAMIGLHGRNPVLEHAGERTLHLLGLLTLLLPLGRRYSLDALLASRGRPARPPDVTPVRSIAVLAITIQLAVVYALDRAVKSGTSWQDGFALAGAIEPMTGSTIGFWVRDKTPMLFIQVLTKSTLVIESVLPLLILMPFPSTRMGAVTLMLALQGGIGLCLNLGVFQPGMMIAAFLLVPSSVWTTLESSRALAPLRALAAKVRAPFFAMRKVREPARVAAGYNVFGEAAVAAVSITLALLVVADNRITSSLIPLPPAIVRPLRTAMLRVGVFETWAHYGDPKLTSAMLVVDAVTSDGRHVDPVNEVAVGHVGPPLTEIPHTLDMSLFWWNFEKSAHTPSSRVLVPLTEWIRRYPLRTKNPADSIVSYEIRWIATRRTRDGVPLETKSRLLRRFGPDGDADAPRRD